MNKPRMHYPSFFGFLLFATAALLLFALGFVLGLSALFVYLRQGSVDVQTTVYSVALFFLGSLSGIVSVISLLRVLNKPAASVPVSTSFGGWKIAAGVTGAGLALLTGYWVQENPSINWLALPLLTIPAVALPIWTITGLGTRDLSLGSRWRTWSAFGISLTVTPFILFMLEVLVAIAILIFVITYAVANPDVAAEFERLSTQFASIELDSEEAMRLIAPYLTRPGVIILAAIFFSVLIPLMEELIKPLAVWLLAGRLDSAAQGFAFGALGGAGFALVETLNVSGQVTQWGILLFTRIGTGLLHIATSAIMGAAIYMAVRERRYLHLLGAYLLAVLLHGLWNASAITVSFSALAVTYNQADGYAPLQWISTIGLIVLAIALLTLLVTFNRKLQKTMPVALLEEAPAVQIDTSL
jgi:hypothetical protein